MADDSLDLSQGTSPLPSEGETSGEVLLDAKYRRHYRTAATAVGIFVIVSLVLALGRIVFAVTSFPKSLRAPMDAAVAGIFPAQGASAAANAASAAGQSGLSLAGAVDTILNPTGAVVGLVVALSVAITVLTIALVRSVFHADSKEPDKLPAVPNLPSAEMLKTIGSTLEAVGKAFTGGASKH